MPIFIGIKGNVLALNQETGKELWRTDLMKGNLFVNVHLDEKANRVYATAKGEIFCLDVSDGAILWNNPLKGLGYGLVTIANAGNPSGWMASVAETDRRAQEAAAASAAASAATISAATTSS